MIRKLKILTSCLIGLSWSSATLAADNIESAFAEGNVDGYIRAYYNVRDFPERANPSAFALGGGLRAETAPVSGITLGAAFYTAQDLGTNSQKPDHVDGRLGSELEVLGEAYVNLTTGDNSITVGRQKMVTPFANPIDVFLVPFTYEGIAVKNNSFANLTLEANYVNTIKGASSHEFINVGAWATDRLGVEQVETSGTLMLGATYKKNAWEAQGWYYNFDDLFDTFYAHVDYTFAQGETLQPFVTVQLGKQQESGEALLGKVDSTLFGVQAGASFGKAKAVVGYNTVTEQENAFNNGGFLTPYTFSTSPMFTSSMVENMENVDSGNAFKFTLFYSFPKVEAKLSHAIYDYTEIADRQATDLDLTYSLNHRVKGLSLRFRLEVVTADVELVEQVDQRFQLQYLF